MRTTICYKTNTPTIYNKGTVNEVQHDTFLAYYTYKTETEAQKEVDDLNTNKPEKLFNGQQAKCNERTYYVDAQPMFDTTGN